MNNWIVIYGNPNNGFSYCGPFSTPQDANDWADNNVATEYDWWITPLQVGFKDYVVDRTPGMTNSQLHTAAMAMRSGGSFACAISEAFFVADKDNKARLLAAFGDLFEKFAPIPDNQGESK